MFGGGGPLSLAGGGGAVGAANKVKIVEVKGWIKEARGKSPKGERVDLPTDTRFVSPHTLFVSGPPITSFFHAPRSSPRPVLLTRTTRVDICTTHTHSRACS